MTKCDHPYAVYFNCVNGVVQCRACGQVWVPLDAQDNAQYSLLVDAEVERLHGSPEREVTPEWMFPADYVRTPEEVEASRHCCGWELRCHCGQMCRETQTERRGNQIYSTVCGHSIGVCGAQGFPGAKGVPSKSAGDLLNEAGVPNMLKGRQISLRFGTPNRKDYCIPPAHGPEHVMSSAEATALSETSHPNRPSLTPKLCPSPAPRTDANP